MFFVQKTYALGKKRLHEQAQRAPVKLAIKFGITLMQLTFAGLFPSLTEVELLALSTLGTLGTLVKPTLTELARAAQIWQPLVNQTVDLLIIGAGPAGMTATVPGIFAAGDVRLGSTKRVGFAVGDGTQSIASVHQFLAVSEFNK